MQRLQRLAKAIQIQMFLLVSSSSYTCCFAIDEVPQGFLWYNEVIEQENTEPQEQQIIKKPDQSDIQDAKTTVWDKNINQLQQKVEQSKRKALDDPTFENVLAAQRAQRDAIEKSKAFAAMWKYVALVDSGIAGNTSNTNSIQKKINEQIRNKQTNKNLRSLSKHWALVLEVEDSCPYCHAFAPLVKEFAAKFGFQLLASSKEGADFAGIQGGRNLGQMIKYNPQHITPVLYLVHENAREVYILARGVTTEEEIIENIMSIDKHERRLF